MTSSISLPRAADMDLDDIPYVEGTSISCMPPAAEYYDDPIWYDSGGRDPLKQREIFKLPPGEERTYRLRGIAREYKQYGPKLYEVAAEAGRADIIRLLLEVGLDPSISRKTEKGDGAGEKRPMKEGEEGRGVKKPRLQEEAEADGDEITEAVHGNADEVDAKDKDQEHATREGSEQSQTDSEEDESRPLIEINPPLTGAAFTGQLECVQVLVDEVKVSIDETDVATGNTALSYAASGGHTDVVKWLLSKGAAIKTPPGGPNLVALALRGGSMAATKAITESEQWKASGERITLDHLPFAADRGNMEGVEMVLSHSSLPQTGDRKDLSADQETTILTAIQAAIGRGAIDCLHLLLPYVTRQRLDGSYEYFAGTDFFAIGVVNAMEDAIERVDDPKLFRLVWETMVRAPDANDSDFISSTQTDANGNPNLTIHEALHRRLISAADNGRVETVKLLHETYGADVNHVSHKYSTTCLGRAAGSGLHDLQGRLAVVRYLLEHTEADASVAQGEFSNGDTPLACSLRERQPEMVKLLLELGGPVESVDKGVPEHVASASPGEDVQVCVVSFPQLPRAPVQIMAPAAFEKISKGGRVKCMTLSWEKDRLLEVLKGLNIRAGDDSLQRGDPKGRPLATAEG